jgi:DNA-binding response OmpR family regulator
VAPLRTAIILLVDDQPLIAAAIGQMLAAAPDIRLHVCADAADAVAVATRLGPALILQDLLMPGIDGLTLVRAYRDRPATARTPVVVLSGSDDPERRAQALAAGAVDVLVKMPTAEALLACIRRHAALQTPQAMPETSAAPAPTSDLLTAPVEKPPAIANTPAAPEAALDETVLAAFEQGGTAGATAFVAALIDQFLGEAQTRLRTVDAAARTGDQAALTQASHALRGSALTVGANRLASVAEQLERHGGRAGRTAVVTVLIGQLRDELGRVQDALEARRAGARP